MAAADTVVVGAVAYDAKVVTIWEGFRHWFAGRGLAVDYVLYSNYERQVEALLDGEIHVAWNSPLAWVRARRMAAAAGAQVGALAMRDTDRDLTSVVVVRADSAIGEVGDLAGGVVAVGAVDSPQATLLPLSHLRSLGIVPGKDVDVLRHDVAVGKHGDHVGGERDAARALMSGAATAACMIDGNHLVFAAEGTLPAGSTRVLTQTPVYDHCNFTVAPDAPAGPVSGFADLLGAMTYDDAQVRSLLDLEGLKSWEPGRTIGYRALEAAVDELGFYDEAGNVTADDYRP